MAAPMTAPRNALSPLDAMSTFRGALTAMPAKLNELDLILGVGLLIGGGFPHAAAAVAYSTEAAFPGRGPWPWSPPDEACA